MNSPVNENNNLLNHGILPVAYLPMTIKPCSDKSFSKSLGVKYKRCPPSQPISKEVLGLLPKRTLILFESEATFTVPIIRIPSVLKTLLISLKIW